jgi:hypothetical protein
LVEFNPVSILAVADAFFYLSLHLIEVIVLEDTSQFVASTVTLSFLALVEKPLPVMLSHVPATEPEVGVKLFTAGRTTKWKSSSYYSKEDRFRW